MTRLYLFLHGLFVIRDLGSQYEIVLPRVEGHVYRAGGWLMETDIAHRADLVLHGVGTGQASLANTWPAGGGAPLAAKVIRLGGRTVTSRRRAAVLTVPRPFGILSLLNAMPSPPEQFVAWSRSGAERYGTLSDVLVFVYDYPSEKDLYLENHPWLPYAVNGSISLHFISTSPVAESKEHEVLTGDALSKLIRGYPGYRFARAMQPDWRYPQPPPPFAQYGSLGDLKPSAEGFIDPQGESAFLQAQLEQYAPRVQRLGLLGRLYQEGRPRGLAWTVPAPLGMEMSNCVSYG